jgi:hypothetical protein
MKALVYGSSLTREWDPSRRGAMARRAGPAGR